MPRGNRYYLSGYVWHIIHRCHKREFLLKFARDRRRWLQWLGEAVKMNLNLPGSCGSVKLFPHSQLQFLYDIGLSHVCPPIQGRLWPLRYCMGLLKKGLDQLSIQFGVLDHPDGLFFPMINPL